MFKKWLLILLVLSLILITLLFLKSKRSSSNVPTSATPTPASTSTNYFKGTYFGFKYPLNFTIEKVKTTDGRVLENWKLTEKDSPTPSTILISLFSSNKELSVFEPVQERRNDPSQFLEEVGRMKELRGILFRTIDRKERTVYFTNGLRILSVDYIALTNDPAKEIEYQTFLEGIDWE